MGFDVIYLTGAPASGKSTLSRKLQTLTKNLIVFEYGNELTTYIKSKNKNIRTQNDLRNKSAEVITHTDVEIVDNKLINLVTKSRNKINILIDSHAVTKEQYGFRVTPFSLKKLVKVKPTKIFVLFTPPHITIGRIKKKSGGRPLINSFEANMHTNLQSNVAIIYAIILNIPIYFIDSSRNATLDAFIKKHLSFN